MFSYENCQKWIENPRVGGSIPPPGTKAPLSVNDINGLRGRIVPPFSCLGKSGTFLFVRRSGARATGERLVSARSSNDGGQ